MSARGTMLSRLVALLRYAGATLRAERLLIFGGFLALLAETGLRLLEPWPLQYLVDHILLSSREAGVSPSLAAAGIACAILLLVVALRALAAYAWTVGFAIAGNRVLLAIRAKVFSHLQILSLKFHSKARMGDLITRLIDDVGMVRDVVVTAAMPLLGSIILLTAMLGVMAWLNWRLTMIALFGAPLLLLLFGRKSKRIHVAARQQRKQVSKVATAAAESLASIKAVQALGMGSATAAEFTTANNADLASGVKVKRLSAGMERSVDVVIGIITAATLFFGVLEVTYERLSVGELLVFLAYLRATAKPIRNWAKFTARISKSAAGAERILELLETDPEVTEIEDPKDLEWVEGKIEFDHVSFDYAGRMILQDASFVIERGESVAIVGASGAGKSTLLTLMMRLFDPVSGTVRIDGHDVKTLRIDSLRSSFSIALQDALLFHGTFRDNLTQGRTYPDELIEKVALDTRVQRIVRDMPLGLDTPIDEHGSNLSNGEKQRISLARALLVESPILLVDEPLTGLDRETAKAVDNVLNHYAHAKTFVFVTHDHAQASRADRVLHVRNGTVVDLGSCSEVTLDQLNDLSAEEIKHA